MRLQVKCPALSGLMVTVVEDDPTLRELLVDILTELGASCAAFDNADDALMNLIALKGSCSLMIVDHGVPGSINGTEFILMVHEKWPNIPAILTSGFQLDAQKATPPVSFLFKPWSVDDLVKSINSHLRTGIGHGS